MTNKSWEYYIKQEYKYHYFKELLNFVSCRRELATVYPPKGSVFQAFQLCPFEAVKVIIVGQDPYHGPGQAMGLSFSVPKGVKIPPSLQNIFKEQGQNPPHGDLTSWTKQGVFLLNRILTVEQAKPMSHANCGWETFTLHMLEHLAAEERPLVFLLWGDKARSLKSIIKHKQHLVLESSHPSPLSVYRGFAGCRHFTLANEFLISQGEKAIDWQIV